MYPKFTRGFGQTGSILLKRYWTYFFPPFADSPRVKPSEMLYIAHEKPPISVTLIAGMQHALIAMMLVIYLVITGTDIGLSDGSLRGFICMGVVVMGFGTVLNGLNTRVSAGHRHPAYNHSP